MRILGIVLVVLYLACEESLQSSCIEKDSYDMFQVYIDSEWYGVEREMLFEGVSRLNAMTMQEVCWPIIEIAGEVEVDHTKWEIDDSLDTFVVYYDEPEWFAESHYADLLGASAFYKNIRLFKFEIPYANQNYTLAVIMHELLHYLGVEKHSDDPVDVMYHAVSPLSTHYTATDRKLFCEIWGC